jgi:prepilin-type N-terminal cleavage/methylation domain-containing protein
MTRGMRSLRARSSQRGFTLIEVLVAITILLVGVLGLVAMIDGANAVTNKTKAREGANSIARSIVEVGRAVPYKSLTVDDMYAALDSRPGLNDTSTGGAHTISSAGFTYDVTMQVCSMDDPRDDLGTHDGTIEFCSGSDVWTSGNVDRNPDDYKRIAITLSWTRRNGTETVKQTSLVSNPIGGLGPTVIRLDPQGVTGTPKTVTTPAPGGVTFDVETNTKASEVRWAVDGATVGSATDIGTTERFFSFNWDIEGTGGGTYYVDGTYVVQAQAFDAEGRSGSPKALTVVLNRALPTAPVLFDAGGSQVGGGRNGNGDRVDLMWTPNPERDVLGYRVYRSITSTSLGGGHWTQVTCLGQTGTYLEDPDDDTGVITCLDEGAPANTPLFYYVAAVDTIPGTSTTRDGTASVLTVDPGNTLPDAPANVSACVGGIPGCNDPTGDPAPDGATVITWDPSTDLDSTVSFYRIYRDGDPVNGPTYDKRYGLFTPDASGVLAWVDPDTPSGPHTYHVTAVADNFGESAPSAPVVSFP